MCTRRSMLPLLGLSGVLLIGCGQKQPETTGAVPSDSVPTPSGTIAGTDSAPPADVVDVTWQWVSITTPVERLDVDAPDRYTIRFQRDGRLTVRADCNRGMGSYSVSPERGLTLKPLALSRAACPPGSLSDRFARDVGRASSYFLKDGDLFLELPVDSGTLRFRRA